MTINNHQIKTTGYEKAVNPLLKTQPGENMADIGIPYSEAVSGYQKYNSPCTAESFQLKSKELHCWCVGLDILSEGYVGFHSILSRDELRRSSRYFYEHDRRRFIIAHGALRRLLAYYLQMQPDQINYVYNKFGKPGLSFEFGSRLKFNLSHSADLALIAIAADSRIGVDLEYIRPQSNYLEIARQFFSADDAEHLERLPKHLRTEFFFSCWTKMEAYLKARGESLANLEAELNELVPGTQWSFYKLIPAPDYIGTLAVEGSGWQITHRQIYAEALLKNEIEALRNKTSLEV